MHIDEKHYDRKSIVNKENTLSAIGNLVCQMN